MWSLETTPPEKDVHVVRKVILLDAGGGKSGNRGSKVHTLYNKQAKVVQMDQCYEIISEKESP